VSVGNGAYNCVVKSSGKCLDFPGASSAVLFHLQRYTCNGTGAQTFVATAVDVLTVVASCTVLVFAPRRLVSKGFVQSSVEVATGGPNAIMLLNRWSTGGAGKVFAFGHVRNRPATG
jgi:hypothetical protein